MHPFQSHSFIVLAIFLLPLAAFPTDSDIFTDSDDIFSLDETPDPDPLSVVDHTSASGDFLDADPYAADLSSPCLLNSSPQLTHRRELIAPRDPPGSSCLSADVLKPGSGSPSGQTATQDLDITRLQVPTQLQDYWCSEFVGWGFGSIPVCSIQDRRGFPSEEAVDDLSILQLSRPTGYTSFLDCSLITPFNSGLCPDENAFCCNAFLPDLQSFANGFGYWCVPATRKTAGRPGPF